VIPNDIDIIYFIDKTELFFNSNGFEVASKFIINVKDIIKILKTNSEAKIANLQMSFKDFEDLHKMNKEEGIYQIAKNISSVSAFVLFYIANCLVFLKKESLVKKENIWIFQLPKYYGFVPTYDGPTDIYKFLLEVIDSSSQKGKKIYNSLDWLSRKKKVPSLKELEKIGKDAHLADYHEFVRVMIGNIE
jgi:hypothetical protein